MSWPYGPDECPRCRFFDLLEPPTVDDDGYELVGGCLHPSIASELFRLRQRDAAVMEPCPCFCRRDAAP